jgi:tetratricopeptide (TPR) repeat protein
MSSRQRTFLVALALLAAIFLTYAPVWNCGFLAWDDNTHVYENARVTSGLSWENVRWALAAPHAAQWIPLTWMSHMLDASLFGLAPGPHHAVNVLWHATNALLLFFVLRQMTGAYWRSACVAALFALHPMNVESVAWVAERKNLLNTFWWLLGIGCYARYAHNAAATCRAWPWLALTTLCMALGLMTKAMIVTMPCTLLLLDAWPLGRLGRVSWPRLIVEKLPLFALAVAGSLMQMQAGANADLLWGGHPPALSYRLSCAGANMLAYLGKLFVPGNFAALYPLPAEAPVALGLAAAAVLVVFLVAGWRLRDRAPYLLVGGLWFLGTQVPVSGIVQAGNAVLADRYCYVPGIGIFIAAVWSAEALLRHRPRLWQPALAGVVLIFLAARSTAYTVMWTDTATLFAHAAAVTENNFVAHGNAGLGFARRGELDEAVKHYRAALTIFPGLAETRNNLGVALSKLGQPEAAIVEFRRAAADDPPHSSTARLNLATHLLRTGQKPEAIALLTVLVKEDPASPLARRWFDRAQSGAETAVQDPPVPAGSK